MKPGLRKALAYLPFVALIAASAYALRSFDWLALQRATASADLSLLLFVSLLNAPHIFLKSERWRVLLRPFAQLPSLRLFHYLLVAYASSTVLPGRAGELVRLYLLRRRHHVPVTASVGVVAVEKLFEVIGILLVLAPLPFLVTLPPWMTRALQILAIGTTAAIVVLLVASRRPNLQNAFLRDFADGLACIRSPGALLAVTGLSILTWVLDATKVWIVLYALHIDVPWVAPFVILLTLNLAIVIPSTPGNLGTFEAGAVAGLLVFGVSQELALAFALIHHVTQVVPVLLAGLSGFSLIDEARREREKTGAQEVPT